jgi:protein SMG6
MLPFTNLSLMPVSHRQDSNVSLSPLPHALPPWPPVLPLVSDCPSVTNSARSLFNPRKHDPLSFSAAQARKPPPKSSGDCTSSVSSYAPSIVSSTFTLSSGTDGSSAPSSLFDKTPREGSKTNAFSNQLKKLYHDISQLKTKLLADSSEPQDESRVVIKGGSSAGADDVEKAGWKKAIEDHKQ